MTAESYIFTERVGVDAAQDVLNLVTRVPAEAQGVVLRLEAASVTSIDGPAVVTLANVARSLDAAGRKAAVVNPSSVFIDGFTDLGLYGELMKMDFEK